MTKNENKIITLSIIIATFLFGYLVFIVNQKQEAESFCRAEYYRLNDEWEPRIKESEEGIKESKEGIKESKEGIKENAESLYRIDKTVYALCLPFKNISLFFKKNILVKEEHEKELSEILKTMDNLIKRTCKPIETPEIYNE